MAPRCHLDSGANLDRVQGLRSDCGPGAGLPVRARDASQSRWLVGPIPAAAAAFAPFLK